MRKRFITFLVFGILLVAIGEWSQRSEGKSGFFKSLNDVWLDFCIGNSGDKLQPPAVTIVRINDGYEPLSIGEEEGASDGKLSRLDYATILGFAAKLDPKSVAFLPTPTFDESRVLNQTDIVPLKDAAMQLPRFTLATTISDDGEQAKESGAIKYPALTVEGDSSTVLTFTRTTRNPDPQLAANGIPSFKKIESAKDLITDESIRVPLLAKRGDAVVPSIVLTSVANHAGIGLDQITVNFVAKTPVIELGEIRTIPINADGTLTLPNRAGLDHSMAGTVKNEAGEPREVLHFTSLTVDELAYTGEENDEVAKRILADFRAKFDSLSQNLVVIGYDRNADRRFTTPGGEALSQTSILARAMATIQSGRFIHWWPGWGRAIAVLAILVIAAVLFRFSRGKFAIFCFVTGLVFFSIWVMIFKTSLTWTPPFSALSLFVLMMVVGLLIPLAKKEPQEEKEVAE